MARPVESKVVISSVRAPALRPSPASTSPSSVTCVARKRARLDRVDELAVVARLLPVVAEDVRPDELFDRDLRLARPVGAHQADVLPGRSEPGPEEDLVARASP